MYQSKKNIVHFPKSVLKKKFTDFVSHHPKIYLKHMGRSIFLDELPEAILKRKDAKMRIECFFVGIDIAKNSHYWTKKIIDGNPCIEIMGKSKEGFDVFIHIREKVEKKDKKLFLISTYYAKK